MGGILFISIFLKKEYTSITIRARIAVLLFFLDDLRVQKKTQLIMLSILERCGCENISGESHTRASVLKRDVTVRPFAMKGRYA